VVRYDASVFSTPGRESLEVNALRQVAPVPLESIIDYSFWREKAVNPGIVSVRRTAPQAASERGISFGMQVLPDAIQERANRRQAQFTSNILRFILKGHDSPYFGTFRAGSAA
jgi:hypothetical protein